MRQRHRSRHGLTRQQIRDWVEESWAAQGIPVEVEDPRIIARLVELLEGARMERERREQARGGRRVLSARARGMNVAVGRLLPVLVGLTVTACTSSPSPSSAVMSISSEGSVTPTSCAATVPTDVPPPGETAKSQYVGNGEIWADVWPENVVQPRLSDVNVEGYIGVKFPFWRAAPGGPLRLAARRLDAAAPPATSDVPPGYGDTGFQASGINFPTPGCWEITATAGLDSLTFITEILPPK